MRTPVARCLRFSLLLAPLAACGGGDLTLPDNASPATLQAISGAGQEGTVGSKLDKPLIVRVIDGSSRPVAGVPVVFRFQSEVPDAQVSPSQATTDPTGHATAQVRLGTAPGAQNVEASVVQATAPELSATFDLTALERDSGKKDKGGKDRGHDEDDD